MNTDIDENLVRKFVANYNPNMGRYLDHFDGLFKRFPKEKVLALDQKCEWLLVEVFQEHCKFTPKKAWRLLFDLLPGMERQFLE